MTITDDRLCVNAHARTRVLAPGANREALPPRLTRELAAAGAAPRAGQHRGNRALRSGAGPSGRSLRPGVAATARLHLSPTAQTRPYLPGLYRRRRRDSARQLPATARLGEPEGRGPPDRGTRAALRAAGTYLVEGQREWVSLAPGWREKARGAEGALACGECNFPVFHPVCTSRGGPRADAPRARATTSFACGRGYF